MKEIFKQFAALILLVASLVVSINALRDIWEREPTFLDMVLGLLGLVFLLSVCLYIALRKQATGIGFRFDAKDPWYSRSQTWGWMGTSITVVMLVLSMIWAYQYFTVPSTKSPKVGIWIARFSNDEASHATQAAIVQKISLFLEKEKSLNDLVEVRAMPAEVTGKSSIEKERRAFDMGQKYNAAVVVWGTIAGELGQKELYPKITIIKTPSLFYYNPEDRSVWFPANWPVGPRTVSLEIVTQETSRQERNILGSFPRQTALLPERVREPIQLARFVVAYSLVQTNKCQPAQEYLEQILAGNFSLGSLMPDTLLMSGMAAQCIYSATKSAEDLEKAGSYFLKASESYAKLQHRAGFAVARNNYATIVIALARDGINPAENSATAVKAIQEALSSTEEATSGPMYSNLALAHLIHADSGSTPVQDLTDAISALTKATALIQRRQDPLRYASLKALLGASHIDLCGHGVSEPDNLAKAKYAFQEAASIYKTSGAWKNYALVRLDLASTQLELADRGLGGEGLISDSEAAAEEIAELSRDVKRIPNPLSVQRGLGLLLYDLGERDRSPLRYYSQAADLLSGAAVVERQNGYGPKYATTSVVLGRTYVELAERGQLEAATKAISVLEEVLLLNKEQKLAVQYFEVLNNLGRAYLVSAQESSTPKASLSRALAAFHEAQKVSPGDPALLTNLGAVYIEMADENINPQSSLSIAIRNLQEAACLRKAQKNWGKYTLVLNALGGAYLHRAMLRKNSISDLNNAIVYLSEAREFADRFKRPTIYFAVVQNAGIAHRMLGQRKVQPDANLQVSIDLMEEVAGHYRTEKNMSRLLVAELELGRSYHAASKYFSDRTKYLQKARVALANAFILSAYAESARNAPAAAHELGEVLCALISSGVDIEESTKILASLSSDPHLGVSAHCQVPSK